MLLKSCLCSTWLPFLAFYFSLNILWQALYFTHFTNLFLLSVYNKWISFLARDVAQWWDACLACTKSWIWLPALQKIKQTKWQILINFWAAYTNVMNIHSPSFSPPSLTHLMYNLFFSSSYSVHLWHFGFYHGLSLSV
jgi:hypothetical protein